MMNTDTRKIFRLQKEVFIHRGHFYSSCGWSICPFMDSFAALLVTYGIIIGSALRAAIYLNSTIAALLFLCFLKRTPQGRVHSHG